MLHYRQASPICGMFKISVDSLQTEDKQSKEQLGQTRSTAAFRGQTTTKIKPCFFSLRYCVMFLWLQVHQRLHVKDVAPSKGSSTERLKGRILLLLAGFVCSSLTLQGGLVDSGQLDCCWRGALVSKLTKSQHSAKTTEEDRASFNRFATGSQCYQLRLTWNTGLCHHASYQGNRWVIT